MLRVINVNDMPHLQINAIVPFAMSIRKASEAECYTHHKLIGKQMLIRVSFASTALKFQIFSGESEGCLIL